MKTLYQAQNASDADELRRFLWVRGIDVTVVAAADPTGASADRQSPLNILVDDDEFDRASKLLVQFTNRLTSQSLQSEWTCLACAEVVGPEFDNCTKCGVPRGDLAPIADPEPVVHAADDLFVYDEAAPIEVTIAAVPGANRSTWSLWLELLGVLALIMPLYGGHVLVGFALKSFGVHNTSANFFLASLLNTAFTTVVALTAIRLSRNPGRMSGIVRPELLDVFTGGIVCIVGIFVSLMGRDIFLDIVRSLGDESYLYQVTHPPDFSHHAQGWSGLLALLLLAIAVGFSEELMFRGYALSRLERLLRSKLMAVFVSAAIFGLLHWSRGIVSMWGAFLIGIVYGIAFVWTRRLWPVVIAHAAHDFSAFLYRAG